jgi:hypothetical protein
MYRFLLAAFIVCVFSLQACNSKESKKETTKESNTPKSLNEAISLSITPLADGGAYASDFGGTIWYLRGNEAVKVKEVDQLTTQPTSLLSTKRERALWALLQQERSMRQSAESERDSYSDNSDNSNSEDE